MPDFHILLSQPLFYKYCRHMIQLYDPAVRDGTSLSTPPPPRPGDHLGYDIELAIICKQLLGPKLLPKDISSPTLLALGAPAGHLMEPCQ